MREVPLTRGLVAVVDDEDYHLVSVRKWHAQKPTQGRTFYARAERRSGEDGGRWFHMHRVIAGAPDGLDVDHVDGNGLNNRRSNLRLCTRQENCCNRPGNRVATSRFKGVSWSSKSQKWKSQIRIDGTLLFLGYYDSELAAACAYDSVATVAQGKYAWRNLAGGAS
jgi:hypothetical protein